MRPPHNLDLPRGWERFDQYLGTVTDTWRIYVYQTRARGELRLFGELWRMDKDPRTLHRGSIESCIEFARAAKRRSLLGGELPRRP